MAGVYVELIEVCRRYDQLAATLAVPTPDYVPVVDSIASTGYVVDEACRLTSAATVLSANAPVSRAGSTRSTHCAFVGAPVTVSGR